MCDLPPAGIGDRWNGVSPDTNRSDQVVSCRLSDGPRQARVLAKFLQRELGVAYQTAWTMAHKLRHGLSEDPSRPLHGFLETDETFIGGRGDPTSPGRSTASPDKSLVVAAVERCRRQRTGAESTDTPSIASMGSSPVMPASPCCRRRPA